MKITFLKSHFSSYGGLEKYTLRLASAFSKKGHDVTLLTTSYPSLPHTDGIKIISLCEKSSLSAYHLYKFNAKANQWLKNNPCDVVFGNDRNTWQTHYRAGNGSHKSYLQQRNLTAPLYKKLFFPLNPLHQLVLKYEKIAFENRNLKMLFTPSQMVRSQILENYDLPQEKVRVVHNGVEWQELENHFQESLIKEKWQKELGLDPSCYQYLFVGHGYLRKGLSFVLDALPLLDNENIHLSIVGHDKNASKFKRMVKQRKLENKVTFFGSQKNVFPFYAASDALLLPTTYDPFANVTLEALALGLYVVSSKFNGGAEIIRSNTGTVIQQLNDPESVAHSLKLALSHPKTANSAPSIRQSVKELDFSSQLDKIVNLTLATAK